LDVIEGLLQNNRVELDVSDTKKKFNDDTVHSSVGGLSVLSKAAWMAVSTPSWWGLMIIPWILSGVLLVGLGWGLWQFADWGVARLVADGKLMGLLGGGLKLILTICLAGFAYFGVALVVQLFSAPIYDVLASRTACRVGVADDGSAQVPFFKAMRQVVTHQTSNILIWLLLTIGLFAASWLIPVIGHIIAAGGSFIAMAAILAFDSLDYAMSRRGWTYAVKWRFVRQVFPSSWLMFVTLAAVVSIPFAGIFFLPISPIAGTLLFIANDRKDCLADSEC